jgi:hypothetical protein
MNVDKEGCGDDPRADGQWGGFRHGVVAEVGAGVDVLNHIPDLLDEPLVTEFGRQGFEAAKKMVLDEIK